MKLLQAGFSTMTRCSREAYGGLEYLQNYWRGLATLHMIEPSACAVTPLVVGAG